MILVDPNIKYIKTFRKYVYQYKEKKDRFYLEIYAEAFSSFTKYVELLEANAVGKSLPYGWASYRTYWLLNNDEDIVGVIRIREKDFEFYGHIGYDIAPKYRKKGYGTKLLELGLLKAKEMGLNSVVLTCHEKNIGSQKIITNNGGEIINTVENPDGEIYYAYIIDL